jgi:predicted N-acyltransferase
MSDSFQIRIISSLKDIDADAWNALQPSECFNPFISYEFLYALEKSGSATSKTGWLGQHLILEDDKGEMLGAIPCYLKNHSQGEYVFDHGWADAFERAGGNYYPKLQCSVPFTPATGSRFLVPQCEGREIRMTALAQGLQQLCERMEVSSAHITFMEEDEWKFAGEQGYLRRKDQQFHWLNDGYKTFDDFLAKLSSRKRKNIKKERHVALADNGITIDLLKGDEIDERTWDRFFAFYNDTGMRKWGQPYLTREFFTMIGEMMPQRTLLIMAKREDEYVAGALNFIGDDCLYGRHWGCLEDHPCLHFEVCYYQAIDYAIEHGLKRVEAGAQGSHKLARGYVPVTTHSAHWITNPGFRDAVEDYLVRERREVDRHNQILSEHAPFKKENKA